MSDTPTLEEQHAQMVAYLHMKVATADWHGVMDAAADLREIEAEIKGRHSLDERLSELIATHTDASDGTTSGWWRDKLTPLIKGDDRV